MRVCVECLSLSLFANDHLSSLVLRAALSSAPVMVVAVCRCWLRCRCCLCGRISVCFVVLKFDVFFVRFNFLVLLLIFTSFIFCPRLFAFFSLAPLVGFSSLPFLLACWCDASFPFGMRRAHPTPAGWSLLKLLVALCGTLVHVVVSDFVFPNFLDTTGLIFNGDAYTTSCINNSRLMYGAQQKLVQPPRDPEVRIAESTDVRETVTTETNPPENAEMTYTFFGHREVYDHSPVDEVCDNRIRMTASEPHQLSSVWYTQGLEVLSGFECSFRFQVTDQSRVCRNVQTADFNIHQYRACKVHGGDGFAFVIQSNENGTATLGQGAESMGYVR